MFESLDGGIHKNKPPRDEEPIFDFERADLEEKEEVARNHGYNPDEIHKKNGKWYEQNGQPIRDKRFDGRREDNDANPHKLGGI